MKHPEHRRRQWAAYRRSPKGRATERLRDLNRRAGKHGVFSLLTHEDLLQVEAHFHSECAYCGSMDRTGYDHVVPLAEGGPNVQANLVPACQSCNREWKGDRNIFVLSLEWGHESVKRNRLARVLRWCRTGRGRSVVRPLLLEALRAREVQSEDVCF